jgi:hypothetical protein
MSQAMREPVLRSHAAMNHACVWSLCPFLLTRLMTASATPKVSASTAEAAMFIAVPVLVDLALLVTCSLPVFAANSV